MKLRDALPTDWQSWILQFGAICTLFAVASCLLDGFDFFKVAAYQWSRRDVPNPGFNTLVYTGTYAGCVLAVTIVLLHARRWVRYSGYTIVVVTVTAHLAFKNINGVGFTYHEALLFWVEMSFILDSLRFFASSYVLPLAITLVGVGSFERFAIPRLPLIHSSVPLLVPLAVMGIHDRLLDRTFSKVYQTPIPYRLPLLTYYAYKHQAIFYGERDEPYIAPDQEPWADHIVLVMDESVRGDLLGVNGSVYDTTPRLTAMLDQFCNYGLISAISNISSSSNIMLQSGLRPDQLPDHALRSLKNPNVFSYMQRAGFAAHLVDAQIYSDKPPNFMTQFDIKSLDSHPLVRTLATGRAESEMDLAATELLTKIIGEQPRTFTYILKSGAHYPYADKAPKSAHRFQPALKFGETTRGSERTLNSYLNALSWAVDYYLENLIEELTATGERVLVIYTADHGQSILEEIDGKLHLGYPHATSFEPPIYQAIVPLMIFGIGDEVQQRVLASCNRELKDRVSGFEIFPSLLVTAGYDYQKVLARYHHSFFDSTVDRTNRVFASGNIFGGGNAYLNEQVRESPGFNLNRFELPQSRPIGSSGSR